MHSRNKGFISVIIILIISFIALKFYFKFDILDFVFKYINKDDIKYVDDKIVFYFNIIKNYILNFYNNNILPILK